MATQVKINFDKATVRQLFKAVAKATDEKNQTSIQQGQTKCRLPISPIAQASDIYVPNQSPYIILVLRGHSNIKAWSDLELVNTKDDWKALGSSGDCKWQSDIGNSYFCTLCCTPNPSDYGRSPS